jgi:hypothetical protein
MGKCLDWLSGILVVCVSLFDRPLRLPSAMASQTAKYLFQRNSSKEAADTATLTRAYLRNNPLTGGPAPSVGGESNYQVGLALKAHRHDKSMALR